MAENSKIEWTHHTLNLWWGCTEVHEGCDNCYARVLSHRWGEELWGNNSPRRRINSVWRDLNKYQRKAAQANEIHRVFVGSMMDIFEKSMPLANPVDHYTTTDDLRQELFSRICAEIYPNLMFLFLTKRPSNIAKYVPAGWLEKPEPNVMYGYSPVNPASFMNVKMLLAIKGKHFLSVEPQLSFINIDVLREWETASGQRIDWIIQGGESGGHKRPFDIAWARSMRDKCEEFGIPYFFKQIDKIQEIPSDLHIRQFP